MIHKLEIKSQYAGAVWCFLVPWYAILQKHFYVSKKRDTDLTVKSFLAWGQTRHTKVEDITVIKEGNKALEAYETVREFWNNPECLTQTDNQPMIAEDYHFDDNELLLIDDE